MSQQLFGREELEEGFVFELADCRITDLRSSNLQSPQIGTGNASAGLRSARLQTVALGWLRECFWYLLNVSYNDPMCLPFNQCFCLSIDVRAPHPQHIWHSLVALPPPPPPSRQLVVAIAVAVAVLVNTDVADPASNNARTSWLDTRRIRGSLHARALFATATTIPATKINTMIGQYDETDGQERASLSQDVSSLSLRSDGREVSPLSAEQGCRVQSES
ncbi:hypothetical protein R3P38DRAFT_3351411 [Favolaschia claudopus]|uniref:Uncharacterized protein n=1 Tax=Favolaschia claudopus TaxID=2862362 RepID=A0AAW0C626_9AGAR